MLVKATNKYEELNLKDKELNRTPKEGEQFEISEERYETLTKKNKYNVVFVEKVEEEIIVKKSSRRTKKIK